jgi:hypothetical protein
MTLEEKEESATEKLPITIHCKKRTLLERILKIEPMHNWQSRAVNQYGLTSYQVCLKCGKARERNKINKYPTFIDCERIKVFDDQFDKNGNYIFHDYNGC